MSNRTIQENLELIEEAVYGREVREAIHDSIEQCYTDVTTSATAASEAATLANAAAEVANNAADNASDAASDASDAADAANDAALAANDAATNATESASAAVSDCTTATTAANTAATAINNLTVTSENVAYSVSASVVVSEVEGHKNIHFKLRQGAPGASYTIKGDAYPTLEDLEQGVPSPEVGDNYNVGTEAPYTIYRWTGTTWEDQGQIGVSIDDITNAEIDYVFEGTSLTGDSKYLGLSALSYMIVEKVLPLLDGKVDVVSGMGLSTNDFTTAYMNKIDQNETDLSALTTTVAGKEVKKKLTIGSTTYTLRTGTAGAANYITFVLE